MTENTANTSTNAQLPLGSIKNYELGEVIGTGVSSVIYQATYVHNGVVVALKSRDLSNLPQSHRESCIAEVKLLKAVKHVNVIKCFEAFVECNNTLYISLQLADNKDLSEKLRKMQNRGTVMSERTIWYFFHQICSGLKAMHEKRILHRDLKPENILLCKNGTVKIADLNLSRMFSENSDVSYDPVGTEYYMAPECRLNVGYTFKSDIWSLGCLLYEMATLQSPFSGESSNVYALYKKINYGEIMPIACDLYSKYLWFFVSNCLSLSPGDRPTAQVAHKAAVKMFKRYEKHLADFRKEEKKLGIEV